jgi:predicted transcriptional regulator
MENTMSTTMTIRWSDALKERVSSAAELAGKTTERFILEAIAEKTELEEQRAGFGAEADARFGKILQSGKTIAWPKMRQYLDGKIVGKQNRRPAAKTRHTKFIP